MVKTFLVFSRRVLEKFDKQIFTENAKYDTFNRLSFFLSYPSFRVVHKMTEKHPSIGSIPGHLVAVTEEKIEEDGSKSYVFKPNAIVTEAIYIRSYTSLLGCTPQSTVQITWVTISQATVKMNNITFKGLIQVTANGQIIANNCTFMPARNTSECAVEIFAQSKCKFTNCTFTHATKAALLVRDRSSAEVNDCTFNENEHSGLLILDTSRAEVNRCKFADAKRFSVYVYRKSSAIFKDSVFSNMQGKGVFILFDGKTEFENCTFNECKSGAISLAESSTTNVKNCNFKNIHFSAVHGIKNCNVTVSDSVFSLCYGNGVNFEHSNGEVKNCKFSEFRFPVFATFGPTAHPHIHHCTTEATSTFAAIARDCSTPVFDNLTLTKGATHCFSISDFSKASVRFCTIKNFAGAAVSAFNGAIAKIEHNTIGNCKFLVDSFTEGSAIFRSNTLNGPMKTKKRFRGTFTLGKNAINGKTAVIDEDQVVPSEEECGELPKIEFEEEVPFNLDELVDQPGFSCLNSPPCKCIKCGAKDAEVFCSPCGHKVLCEECSKAEKKCPLCGTSAQKFVKCFPSDKCLICFGPPDTILLPCGHANICYSCVLKLWSEGRKCPECREKMLSFRHVFSMSDV